MGRFKITVSRRKEDWSPEGGPLLDGSLQTDIDTPGSQSLQTETPDSPDGRSYQTQDADTPSRGGLQTEDSPEHAAYQTSPQDTPEFAPLQTTDTPERASYQTFDTPERA